MNDTRVVDDDRSFLPVAETADDCDPSYAAGRVRLGSRAGEGGKSGEGGSEVGHLCLVVTICCWCFLLLV